MRRRIAHSWWLLPILAVALGLRLFGLDWDGGHLFHPDERHILMVTSGLALPLPPDWELLASIKSPLNPHFFAYGSFPFYLLKLVAHLLASLAAVPGLEGLRTLSDFDHLRQLGRVLSALFDTGTVWLVYVLGRRLYDRRVGLLGAALLALTVLSIQLSHFFAFDTILTFFMLLSTLLALNLAEKGTVRAALALGVAMGLALGTKPSAAPIVAVAAGALAWRLATDGEVGLRLRAPSSGEVERLVHLGLLVLGATAATFVVVEPYALIDFATFSRNLAEQGGMVWGTGDLPYTRQYANTPPYWYFIQNLLTWGMGWPLGLTALAGTAFVLYSVFRRPSRGELLLLAWMVPYFLITGSFYAKFLRYLLPIIPVLCLFGARGLMALWDWARPRGLLASTEAMTPSTAEASPRPGAKVVWLAGAVISAVLVLTTAYAVAFLRIYAVEHTGVQASRWIYQNIPDGARLAKEHWEEGLPVALRMGGQTQSIDSHHYGLQELRLYEDDNPAKFEHIAQVLASSDYILFYSQRLYATIPRLPERYPITSRYYQLLFSEQLGFELVAHFVSYPNLLGVSLADDTFSDAGLTPPPKLAQTRSSSLTIPLGKADESFTVYDHPTVLVFQKRRDLSRAELQALFGPVLTAGQRPGAQAEGLLLTPERQQALAAGGTYSEMFNPDSLANRVPWLVWVLLVEALGVVALPIAFVAFPHLADRGYLLAKTLGFLLVTWLAWMLVNLGLLPNTRLTLVLATLVVAGVGAALAHRHRQALSHFWAKNRRLIIVGEAVFWGAFMFFLAIRLLNPDLWHPARGGEKPMDLAYLMAAIKTVDFPPYDPWFAGGYLNYYYYGQILVGTLVKLSAVIPTTAYNLVVPTLFALTVGGAFSVAYNLAAARLGESPSETRGSRGRPYLAGAAAALLLGVAGNLATAAQIVEQLWRNSPLPDFRSTLPGVEGAVKAGTGLWATAVGGKVFPIPTDWYWASSRVYTGPAVVNEFPYFSFLYADLHAHMIAFPFAVLAIGVAVNSLKDAGAAEGSAALGANLQAWLGRLASTEGLVGTVVAALALGVLAPTNSWDFPTYLVVFGLALLIGWRQSEGPRLPSLGVIALRFGLVAALAFALYWPFHRWFQSFYSGLDPSPEKSDLVRYLAIHGLFLFILLTYLVSGLHLAFHRAPLLRALGLVLRRWEQLPRWWPLYRALARRPHEGTTVVVYAIAALLVVVVLLALMNLGLVAFLFALLVPTILLATRRRTSPEHAFILTLLGLGFALGIFGELFAIKGDIGRMNTIFKLYLQVWVMWAVAAGVAFPVVWHKVEQLQAPRVRLAWRAILIALLFTVSIYPVVGTRARLQDRFDTRVPPTLDGTAYAATAEYHDQNRRLNLADDMAAIRWMQQKVQGSPVILEASVPTYRWGSRFSIYTGLPTVLGWDWHQKQQRWGYQWMVEQRLQDVKTMYGETPSEQVLSLLDKYQVKYIVVGEVERAYYPAQGLAKFDAMVGSQLELVYQQGTVKIYERKG